MKQVSVYFIFSISTIALLILCTVLPCCGAASDDWNTSVQLFEKDGVQRSFYITLTMNEVMLVFAIGLGTVVLAFVEGFKTFAMFTLICSGVLAVFSANIYISTGNENVSEFCELKNLTGLHYFTSFCCVAALAQAGVSVWLLLTPGQLQALMYRANAWLLFELFLIMSLAAALTLTANLTSAFATSAGCTVTPVNFLKIVLTYVVVHLFAIAPLMALLNFEVPTGIQRDSKESSQSDYCKL